jgi:E3 ubiquitin-protein ligase HUWE1
MLNLFFIKGYPRAAAEAALSRTGNNVARAVDYLLSNPSVVAGALFSSLQASSSASAATAQETSSGLSASGSSSSSSAETSSVPSTSADATANTETGSSSNNQPFVNPTEESMDEDDDEDEDNNEDEDEDVEEDDEDELAQALALSMNSTEEKSEFVTGNDTSLETGSGKGKEPAQDSSDSEKDLLDKARKDLLNRLPDTILSLLDHTDNVVFDVKGLISIIMKSEMERIAILIIQKIQTIRIAVSSDIDNTYNEKRLSTILRLVALIVNDPVFQSDFISQSATSGFETHLLEILKFCTEQENKLPTWLSPTLLILEVYISIADEPKASNLIKEDKETGILSIEPLVQSSAGLSEEQKSQLMAILVRLLGRNTLHNDLLHSLLRISTRLTRSNNLAQLFVELGGLPYLFRHLGEHFPGRLALTIIILRHVVEVRNILITSIEREISHWFSYPRARTAEINSYLKANAHLACRDPEIFIECTSRLCILSRYDPTGRHQTLALKPKPQSSELASEDPKMAEAGSSAVTSPVATSSIEKVVSDLHRNATSTVLSFLISEILRLKNGELHDSSEATDHNHIKRGLSLQCLSELVISFPNCRLEVLALSQKILSKNLSEKPGRNPLLSHLLNDLLPSGINSNESDQSLEIKRKTVESNWAALLIIGMCTGPSTEISDDNKADLASLRKAILDSISRSWKDAIHSNESLEIRYSRFVALSDLCYKILTIRSNGSANRAIEDALTSCVKVMLEKGFVTTMTSALTEVDVFHPLANTISSSILKPLELLTKIAIKIARKSELSKSKEPSEEKLDISMVTEDDLDDDDDMQDDNEEETGVLEQLSVNESAFLFIHFKTKN